jgi:hypothetical protein
VAFHSESSVTVTVTVTGYSFQLQAHDVPSNVSPIGSSSRLVSGIIACLTGKSVHPVARTRHSGSVTVKPWVSVQTVEQPGRVTVTVTVTGYLLSRVLPAFVTSDDDHGHGHGHVLFMITEYHRDNH